MIKNNKYKFEFSSEISDGDSYSSADLYSENETDSDCVELSDSSEEELDAKLSLQKTEKLYNSQVDKENETWLINKLKGHCNISGSKSSEKKSISSQKETSATHQSDAQLCCPKCFVTLCLDCQQAMFVENCLIKEDEILKKKKTDNKKISIRTFEDAEEFEIYKPVVCENCELEVAVYDKDEIYHFFNVLAA
ncbi:hypothetical protein HDU92_000746 [Lobulomyces angularis]|nr:hypothetical protein HDU92_000746 [Lobulomyces angularis]